RGSTAHDAAHGSPARPLTADLCDAFPRRCRRATSVVRWARPGLQTTMGGPLFDPAQRIADDSGLSLGSVRATLRMIAEGASVPFIARYRKEQTGGFDEVQIRH